MKEVLEFLKANPVQYVATVGLDGKPKVRPFQFMAEKDGKFYFCTSNEKKVYEQIKANGYIEICAASPEAAWLRLSGKVMFSQDKEMKEKIIESSPLVKSIYKNADNPTFEIFYLDNAQAEIADFSGNPPKKFNM